MNKGDLVRISGNLEVGKEYGDVKVFEGMESSFGAVGRITDTIPEEKAVKVCGWWWSEEVVSLVNKFEPDVYLRDFIVGKVNEANAALQGIIDALK